MSTQAHVVIGANFGDEGKGLVTDYLARTLGADCVVRFNGGAQAGHTVVTPQGQRHVFHHFGSGTLVGVPTYLSRFFVVNPYVFHKELQELHLLGAEPQVDIHPNAPVTTPYDMVINQLAESLRGDKRHGSVGLGIGETIERGERFHYLSILEALSAPPGHLRALMLKKFRKWATNRAAELVDSAGGYTLKTAPHIDKFESVIHSEQMVDDWLGWLRTLDSAHLADRPPDGMLLFEGAQGLGLDQNNMTMFPYVTRSNTGIRNVVQLLHEFNQPLTGIDVTYVTRNYLTRHGAGPLPGETLAPSSVVDSTNVDHPWQGSLRFAPLGLSQLRMRVVSDIANMAYGADLKVPRSYTLAVTCCDQYPQGPSAQHIAAETSLDLAFASYGPTYRDVRPNDKDE